MAEHIERAKAKEELLSWARCIKHPEHLMTEDAMCVLDSIPASDVVEVSAVEAWLLNIALNNTGRVSNVCEELASRMDGLRKFAADRRE